MSLRDSALSLFTSYGRSAGSARVRVFDWIDWLDLDAHSHTFLGTATNAARVLAMTPLRTLRAQRELEHLARTGPLQTVLISRQASPFSNGRLEAQLLERASLGVYDFDDALMFSPPSTLGKLWPKAEIWRRSVAVADTVIAGNELLADQASALSNDVVVIPSCVDPNHYERKTNYELGDHPRAVWMGSPSTEQYLNLIAEPLLALHRLRGLRLLLISAGDADLGALEPMVDRVDWTMTGFGRHLQGADFGIMPLADNNWTRGKCAYKLLQYGASGLPLIGSPVGANREVLEQAGGFAPGTDEEWIEALDSVIHASASSRSVMGTNAYDTVVKKYSFAAWEDSWLTAMRLNRSDTGSGR